MRNRKWARRAAWTLCGLVSWSGCASTYRNAEYGGIDMPVRSVTQGENDSADRVFGVPGTSSQKATRITFADELTEPAETPAEQPNVPRGSNSQPVSTYQANPTTPSIPKPQTIPPSQAMLASQPAKTATNVQASPRALPTIRRVNAEVPVEVPNTAVEIVSPVEGSVTQTSTLVSTMSLFDLLSYAQTNHPLLAVREQEVGLARAEVVGAGLRDNPQFVLDTDTPVNEAGDTQLGMRLTFPFYTANKRELAKIAAVAGVHRACMARGIDEMEIMLDAVDAASEVLYLTNLLEVQKELREFAAKRAEAYTEDLVPTREGGFRLTGRLDVEMSALDLESREYKTRRELIVAQSTLAQVIGAPADVPISVSDPMEIEWGDLLPLEQVKALAAERSPMIAEVNAAINETHKLHILAHAEKVPDIELGPRYQDELGVNGTDSAGLRFNMDLPTSDRNQGDIAATAAQLQVDGANLELARYTAVNQAVVVYQELDRIRQDMRELERRKEILQQRFEEFFSAEQIRRALPEGEALGLAQDLLKQKVNEVELRYQFFRQSRRLEVMIGQPVVMSSAQ